MMEQKEVRKNNFVDILTKYTVNILLIMCLIIHAFFAVIFFMVNVNDLAVLNICSAVCYALFLLCIKKFRMVEIVTLAFVEILLYSVISTVLVGMDCGFFMYPIAMIPVMYFLTDIIKSDKTYPFACALVGTAVISILAGVMMTVEPLYKFKYLNYWLMIVNILILAGINITFSYLFVKSVLKAQEYLAEKNELLNILSSYDPLTNLYNRRAMDTVLKENTSKSYAICICDIDDFKKINDIYGHNAGDMVLKNVAELHKNELKEGNICRWGGEELLILLKDVDKKEAFEKIDAVRKSVSEQMQCYEDEKFGITMTYGLVLSEGYSNYSEMIKKADDNLYIGKKNGKNCVIC